MTNFQNKGALVENYEKTDLWERLSQTQKPIVIYGMGNGADKIVCELERHNVAVSDFFASDAFVRGQLFHDKKVLTYADVCRKYDDFIVIVAFGSSRREVIDTIKGIDGERELYVPDMPVFGSGLFDRRLLEERINEITSARDALFDERSRAIFDSLVNYKLSGKISYLEGTENSREDIMTGVLRPSEYRTALDLGAFVGDSAAELIAYAPGLEKLIAVEPDRHSFKRLSAFAESVERPKVLPINACVSDSDGELTFSDEGNRNSSIFGKKKQITVNSVTVDSLLDGDNVDYIKIDVEGAEREALRGAKETIEKFAPDLLVSLYHRYDDFFDLINIVHDLCPGHRLYIRRPEYLPPWDTSLYAVK